MNFRVLVIAERITDDGLTQEEETFYVSARNEDQARVMGCGEMIAVLDAKYGTKITDDFKIFSMEPVICSQE